MKCEGFTLTRTFNAPRDTVFAAWSNADALKQWYAPQGCTLSYAKVDFREGGTMHTCIQSPSGPCWVIGKFLEVVKPSRIVFTSALSDENGGPAPSSAAVGKDPEWPLETVITVTFEAQGERTRMTLHQTAPEDVAKRTGAYPSWLSMFDRLEGLLRRP